MADESKSRVQSIREWVVEHKLRTVGCLWLSGITGSIAYNWSQPNMKTSVKIIHASEDVNIAVQLHPVTLKQNYISASFDNRLHAQALTLAALAGAAVVEYYDHKSGAKAERVASFLETDDHARKY